jgi:hypothetical protein
MRNGFFIVGFLCVSCLSFGQVADRLPLDSAVNNVLTQVLLFPQEKIYVQTDKPYYISGETIFFRIFLLDALSHQPSDISRYVYVELINPLDSIVVRHQIRPENNMHYGTIALSDELEHGNYRIRAYTRFMENMPEEYFYTQSLYIADPGMLSIETETEFDFINDKQVAVSLRFIDRETREPILPAKTQLGLNEKDIKEFKPDKDGWINVKFNLAKDAKNRMLYVESETKNRLWKQYIFIPFPEERFDVTFYPEGGHLIAGQSCVVAFKVLSSEGLPVEIEGEILDEQNTPITQFTTVHEGMGRFYLMPESNKSYFAVCRKNDKYIRVELPKVQAETFGLATVWRQNRLYVSVKQPEILPQETLYLVIHTGGMINYAGEWDFSKQAISIERLHLPSGVSHLLLLNENYQAVSERLVFNLNDDWIKPAISSDKTAYQMREQVQMNIDCSTGNLAVSITDDKEIRIDTTQNILTTILLTSELRGYIDNPIYYFQENEKSKQAADLLMLTHGWTRYDIPKAMCGDFQHLTVQNEVSQSVSGLVKGGLLNKLYQGAKVSLISTDNQHHDVIKTDENGQFVFEDFELPDNTTFFVQALSKRNSASAVMLEMDVSYSFPKVGFSPIQQRRAKLAENSPFEDYVKKAEEKYTVENGMRVYQLDEITVRGRRIFQDKKYETFVRLPGLLRTMSEEEIMDSGGGDIVSVLQRLGVPVQIGVFNYKMGQVVNLMLVRGEWVSMPAEWIHIHAADLQAAGIGPRGYPVFIFKSLERRTEKHKFNVATITPLGYQTPTEFYSPQYDTPELRNNLVPDLRSTIYWQPNVVSDENGKASLSFYTADSQSTYSAVIEGVTSDGKLIYQRADAFIKIE